MHWSFGIYASLLLTHQSHNVPGVLPTEGPEAAEADGHHNKDDDGTNVDPEVGMHSLFDCAGEGEHTHYTEGEQ